MRHTHQQEEEKKQLKLWYTAYRQPQEDGGQNKTRSVFISLSGSLGSRIQGPPNGIDHPDAVRLLSRNKDVWLKNQWAKESLPKEQVSRLETFNLDSITEEDARFKSIETDAAETHFKLRLEEKKSTREECQYMDSRCFRIFPLYKRVSPHLKTIVSSHI